MDIKVATWNIRGLCTSDKQDEVRKLINEEKLQICAIIETHVKFQKVNKMGQAVFGNWEFVTNAEDNNKGCRVMVGWNQNKVNAWLIAKTKQSMLFLFETTCQKSKFFCSFVYASNSGVERRNLWKELGAYRQIINKQPWVVSGDFNVTLDPKEHSNGCSAPSNDMIENVDIECLIQS
ncbi:RNA-directed DNA polymerase, eukaryota, Reverse transcriptase zinc-binding domain protein [Artemisia annua]|uniref:RNA-directed DNA polymerase, eukaryota, Reverse transcriptase zinc-binding domain protein n=1 Tax=Artemisia annua TaxID=35608 RepID=A0A2U1MZ22_ARTAN|nr:RNA-directed DNA polymerase, eukaryota, Reverse transcriptase zinc-binding domain protein [Artemisia annua]